MSIGIGGNAQIVMQDEKTVGYAYAPYNLNVEAYRNPGQTYDGLILIDKSALVEPVLHEKIKKWPSGRKQRVVTRIPRVVDYDALIAAGAVSVLNSKFCWKVLPNGVGSIAMRLLRRIFERYQASGELPESISYHI